MTNEEYHAQAQKTIENMDRLINQPYEEEIEALRLLAEECEKWLSEGKDGMSIWRRNVGDV